MLKKLHRFLKNLNEKNYLKRYHTTLKCDKCKKWSHEKYLDNQNDRMTEKSWGFKLKCGNCGKTTRWNTQAAPVPLKCGKKGRLTNED
jgi:hypothetical protein